MKVTLIGIDLAKNIFQVCGVNQAGKRVFNRQVRQATLLELLVQHRMRRWQWRRVADRTTGAGNFSNVVSR